MREEMVELATVVVAQEPFVLVGYTPAAWLAAVRRAAVPRRRHAGAFLSKPQMDSPFMVGSVVLEVARK